MLRVVHIRNKKWSNKQGILQTWSIVSVAMLLNQQERSQRKYLYIWGVRVRQHLRSLAPVMNEYWWLWRPNDIRGPWGPKASWHLSYRWGKTPKNLTQETCPHQGSNPGPLCDKRTCYHLPRKYCYQSSEI